MEDLVDLWDLEDLWEDLVVPWGQEEEDLWVGQEDQWDQADQ